MYGQPQPFRHGGGGGGRGAAQQQIHPNTNIFPSPNFFIPQQNPTFLPYPNPYLQNPISFPQIQQQPPCSNVSFQTNPDNHRFQAPPPTSGSNHINLPQQEKKMVEEVDKAAKEAWRELLESNENVSAWKVSMAALLKLKADSWKSLGYEMHQVPSLSLLLAIEQKIHAFISCFVAVRRITSLYDLEVAICESEGVERFEELELGPLLRHPLVVHYFSVNSDLTEIYRITTEDIIYCLCEFIDNHKEKEFKADTFLDFVSKKKSVNGREKLCVRVKELGGYINHIKQAKLSEDILLDKCYEKMRTSVKRSHKHPLFSVKKQDLDDHFTAIPERIKSFSMGNTQFCGKHKRFASSSSDDSEANEYRNNQDEKNTENNCSVSLPTATSKSLSRGNTQFCGKHTRFGYDDDDDSEANEYRNNQDEKNKKNNCSVSLPIATSDRVSSCPYPSAIEEMTRLGLKNELESGFCTPAGGKKSNADSDLSQRKKRCKNRSYSTSLPSRLRKRDKVDEDLKNKGSDNQATGDHSISTESLKMFFTTWKEACQVNGVDEVRNEKLLADIGLKPHVPLDDALSVLRLWRKSESHFKASCFLQFTVTTDLVICIAVLTDDRTSMRRNLSQMSNFYSFIWKGMALSKKKVQEELHSGPFIFVPNTSIYSEEAAVSGMLLSPQEVYWRDTIGTVDQINSVHPECVPSIANPQRKMLYNFYPNLHDFFVNECGVDERPPFCSYLQILLQLSNSVLPHQAAKRVCEVFLMWDDALKSGLMSSEDVMYLRESLQKKEYTILPTRLDKWVSLHSSFGLICWRDDDDLGKEFRQLGGVDFLYFGESIDEEYQMLRAKVSTIMQRLGVPALSEIVTREPIYYGSADCSFVFSLVNWVLPYAQRYIYNTHPDKYFQLKQSDFENIKHLKIVVVKKLFYRNVIKKHEITSRKRHLCNCLLQENILYCNRESDTHSVFLELSCLLLCQDPNLQFANFLHMITTMVESGATEEETELFILNSQKVPKLPTEGCIWSLQSCSSSNNNTLQKNSLSGNPKEQSSSVIKRRPGINSSWPPVDWKTTPGVDSVSIKSQNKAANRFPQTRDDGISVEENVEQSDIPPTEMGCEMNIEVDPTLITQGAVLLEPDISELQSNVSSNFVAPSMNLVLDSADLDLPDLKMFVHSNRTGQVSAQQQQQAMLTGRLGELVAFRYFVGKVGDVFVKWVNDTSETGLPYDIVLGGDDENSREYVEVKATKHGRKNWFMISMREWQFAVERGESFNIAHVVLTDNKMAKVTVYKNPARLCQLGNLRLALVVPRE